MSAPALTATVVIPEFVHGAWWNKNASATQWTSDMGVGSMPTVTGKY